MTLLSRRSFLAGMGSVAALTVAAPAIAAPVRLSALVPARPASHDRYVSFYNQHTGEAFEGLYRYGNQYIGASLHEINRVMRDFRTNEVTEMDPRLVDIMFHMQQMIRRDGGEGAYEVISAYRSKKTNDMLRRNGEGVAKNSYHVMGQAVDLRLHGFSTRQIQQIALDLRAGGVGYYPSSDFVHVDTGPVRRW